MSITDELREWAKTLTHWWYDPVKDEYTYTTGTMPPSIDAIRLDSNIIAIADRIDAEHEEAMQREHEVGHAEGYGAGLATVALGVPEWIAQHEGEMAELGWVRLPKDADGVPIRIGDKVTVPWRDKVYEVRGFSYTEQLAGGQRTIWVDVYSRVKMGNVPLCGASSCRHYHAPTVEDVLREFALAVCKDDALTIRKGVVETFAAKLRLAKEDA